MEAVRRRNNITKNIDETYDNTQRLIKNLIESLKRFHQQNNAQKLKNLFAHEIKKYLWTGFFIFGAILVINVVIMTFYLADSGYNYNLMDNSYVDAVLPEQDIGGIMDLGIVRIEEAIFSELSIGDQIVIYGDFALDVYWVETIVGLDSATQNIELTYDNVTTNTYHIEEVIGQYTSDADFFGSIYYASIFTRGYIFMALSHVLLLFGYWYAFLSSRKPDLVTEEGTDYAENFGVFGEFNDYSYRLDTLEALRRIEMNIPPATVSNIERALETAEVIEAINIINSDHIIRSKADIIEHITSDTGLSSYKGKMFLKYFAQVITDELSKGNDIHVIRFGKFTTVTMPAKEAVNPRTNKKIVVPEHRQARLRFYNDVKSKL